MGGGECRAGVEIALAERPDLALVDITLPDKSGIDLIKDLKAVRSDLKILVISMHEESLYAERALRAGARGYITKQEGGAKPCRQSARCSAGRFT